MAVLLHTSSISRKVCGHGLWVGEETIRVSEQTDAPTELSVPALQRPHCLWVYTTYPTRMCLRESSHQQHFVCLFLLWIDTYAQSESINRDPDVTQESITSHVTACAPPPTAICLSLPCTDACAQSVGTSRDPDTTQKSTISCVECMCQKLSPITICLPPPWKGPCVLFVGESRWTPEANSRASLVLLGRT